MSKPKLYVMCGIQGSGKSTTAKQLEEESGAFLLSSDSIRLELYGNESDQSDNAKVFDTLYHRAKFHLNNGSDVIIDAMNISRKRRMHMINTEFANVKCNKEVLYMATPIETCIQNDSKRDRTVGHSVIINTCKNMQVPIYSEGWNKIDYFTFDGVEGGWKNFLDNVDNYGESLEDFSNTVGKYLDGFEELVKFNQHSSYHSMTLGEHIYQTFLAVRQLVAISEEQYDDYDYAVLMMSAIFHDLGKPMTKSFKDSSGNTTDCASYYNHHNVSAQLVVSILSKMGAPFAFINDIMELVLFHMDLYQEPNKHGVRKVEKLLSEHSYKMLLLLNEADRLAH